MEGFVDLFRKNELTVDDRSPFITFQLPISGLKLGLLVPSPIFWGKSLTPSQMCSHPSNVMLLLLKLLRNMGRLFARIRLGDSSGVAFPVPIVATSSTSQSYDHDEFLLTSVICSVTMLGNHVSILSARTPLKPTKNDQSTKLRTSIVEGILLTLLTSLLLESKFEPFETVVESTSLSHKLSDLFALGHILNNLIAAAMTYLMLNFGNSLLELTMTIAGYKTVSFMNHPLLLSTSPTDFWARRWNRVVQGLLKVRVHKSNLYGGEWNMDLCSHEARCFVVW
eukprot:scaffold30497_cov51-Attheya_sp.AAC.1